jgi:replicative DNA helicase
VIDYVQLLNPPPGPMYRNRYETVAAIADGIYNLSKKHLTPVIQVSQLSRPDKSRNEAPSLHDLRDAGQLGQHSHVVGMVWKKRDDYTLSVVKARLGKIGNIRLAFRGETSDFQEMAA